MSSKSKSLIESFVKELDGLVPRFDDEEEERSISDVKDLHRTMCDKIPKVIGALLSSNALPDDVVSENVMELIDAYLRVASCCLYARQLYSTIQWNCMLECLEKILDPNQMFYQYHNGVSVFSTDDLDYSISASCLKRSRDAVLNAAGLSEIDDTRNFESLKEVSCLKDMSQFPSYNFNYVNDVLERFHTYGGLESLGMILTHMNDTSITHPNAQLILVRMVRNISFNLKESIVNDFLWLPKDEDEEKNSRSPRLLTNLMNAKYLDATELKTVKLPIVYELCLVVREMYVVL